jgi:ADP-ribose pyrophosphatase
MNNRNRRIITNVEHVVYQNKYARVYDNDVTFPGDHKGRYLKLEWSAPYGVAILPILDKSKIYLVHSFRYASDELSIEIPKGFGVERVPPTDMAARELLEETGLVSTKLQHTLSIKTDGGLINHSTHMFLARDCRASGAPAPEKTEVFAAPLIVTHDEAMQLVRSGQITDSLTIAALLMEIYNVFI